MSFHFEINPSPMSPVSELQKLGFISSSRLLFYSCINLVVKIFLLLFIRHFQKLFLFHWAPAETLPHTGSIPALTLQEDCWLLAVLVYYMQISFRSSTVRHLVQKHVHTLVGAEKGWRGALVQPIRVFFYFHISTSLKSPPVEIVSSALVSIKMLFRSASTGLETFNSKK